MSHFQEFLATYAEHSESTRRVYESWVHRFADYCQRHDLAPLKCRREHIEAYFQELAWRSGRQGLYSANTLYIARRTVSRFFYWAVKSGLKTDHPYADEMPKPVQPVGAVLTAEQLLRLFNLPDLSQPLGVRNLLILEAIFELGWSGRELLAWGLEWDERLEPIEPTWRRYCERARPLLARADTKTLLVTRGGGPYVTLEGPRQLLRAYGKALNLPFTLAFRVLHRTQNDLAEKGARRRLVLNP